MSRLVASGWYADDSTLRNGSFVALFKKKKQDDTEQADSGGVAVNGASAAGDKAAKSKGNGDEFRRDPAKARRFFEHAETVSETRNYDYAIECYLNGLRHDPDNMIRHEALREIALKRKVSGGKAARFGEKGKFKGKSKIDKLLHAEFLWAKDPLNLQRMIEVMERAVEADDNSELHLAELAYWVGDLIINKNETQKPPTKADMLKMRDLFEAIEAWQEAVNATRAAIELDPSDAELLDQLKDLEAELAIGKGGYDADARSAVRDMDLQQDLDAQDQLSKTDDAADRIIARHREAFDQNPEDVDLRIKLVRALVEKDSDDTENEAIKLLEEAHEQTGLYKHKSAIGDVKIKQMIRHLRLLKKKMLDDPKDAESAKAFKKLTRERLAFELEEFDERVKNYPTDKRWRYELARRQFMFRNYDDAMANFQLAKEDPKYRAAANSFLGQCYLAKQWYDEAIDTLRAGIEQLDDPGSAQGLEMRWYLTTALVKTAVEHKNPEPAREAQKVASQILQTDVNYKNIKERIEQIRTLVKKLQQKNGE
jgi:hypothetical protein